MSELNEQDDAAADALAELVAAELPEVPEAPVVEPEPDSIGRRLFKALEEHTPKPEDANPEELLKTAQATWAGLMRCSVEDANKFGGWMLVALCGYSTWYRSKLLTANQAGMLTTMMQDAQNKWRAMHTYSDGSYQFFHDIQCQPITGRFIEGAETDINHVI